MPYLPEGHLFGNFSHWRKACRLTKLCVKLIYSSFSFPSELISSMLTMVLMRFLVSWTIINSKQQIKMINMKCTWGSNKKCLCIERKELKNYKKRDMEIGVILYKNKKSYILQWWYVQGITMMIMNSLKKKEIFLVAQEMF